MRQVVDFDSKQSGSVHASCVAPNFTCHLSRFTRPWKTITLRDMFIAFHMSDTIQEEFSFCESRCTDRSSWDFLVIVNRPITNIHTRKSKPSYPKNLESRQWTPTCSRCDLIGEARQIRLLPSSLAWAPSWAQKCHSSLVCPFSLAPPRHSPSSRPSSHPSCRPS